MGVLRRCVDALLLACLVVGVPLSWVLRDGLGPDSVASSGAEAVLRTLAEFGPPLLFLAALSLGVRAVERISTPKQL